SKHKLRLTLKNAQTGKPMPSIGLNLSANTRKTTATFSPAAITTDKNGQAETEIAFGKQPGLVSVDIKVPRIKASREVLFYTNGAGIDIDITLGGASGKLSELSDFSYRLGIAKTRKRLVFKTKNTEQPAKSVPYVDLVFNDVGRFKGSVTFEPKKVRTDTNGRAVTYITFGAGQTDAQIEVQVNMVLTQVRISREFNTLPAPLDDHFKPYPYDIMEPVAGIKNIDLIVDGKLVLGYLLKQYAKADDPEHITFVGVLPLNANVDFRFQVRTIHGGPPLKEVLYIISSKKYNTNIKLNQGYTASDRRGLVKIRMNAGSEPGPAVINLAPLKSAQLRGKIRVVGMDKDLGPNPTFGKLMNLTPINISSQEKFKHRTTRVFSREDRLFGKPIDGMRIEIDIRTRKIMSVGVEIGVFVKLFEGASKNTTDLDDVACKTFVIPWVPDKPVYRDSDGPMAYWKKKATNEYDVPQSVSPDKPPYVRLDNTMSSSFFSEVDYKCAQTIGIDQGSFDTSPEGLDRRYVINDLRIRPNEVAVGKLGGDAVYVVFEFQLAPINWIPVFGAPAAVTPDLFSFSDVNVDGQVNVMDLVLVSNTLEETDPTNLHADVNRDGIFTIADLIQVAQDLGQSTGSDTRVALVVPQGLTYATVEEWIVRARAVADGSLVFQYGIANLERLLTLIIPEKTALFTNYPNPFNPETWIPYHLAEPADVTLTIYAVDGTIVRHLDLGHQAAGFYQSKSRAAHWDGRNDVGERVASGIYFYTLTAGEFAATQKMLILK
ncbi:MAG: dockerin type I domain-containing protein, partial [Candidatus Poribacteria bacterium]|nr:dockerin type I domain-containing protein [Candidatus Poribacteria bacterium]